MGVTMMNISTFLLDATAAIVSPTNTKAPRSALVPINGAPLASDASLVPQKYLEKADTPAGPRDSHSSPVSSTASAVNLHPGIHNPHLKLNLVRSPPSQLLDAPARAALNMPNAATASGQARAVRGGEAKTPEYDIEAEDGISGGRRGREEHVPLLAPTAVRPGLSRSSSTASTSSNRGILRRIFIDRATTPNQHLSRPTFPPPSLSTYSPLPPSPLTLMSKINLFINQTISILLSTVFLAGVVSWAASVEIARALPGWISKTSGKKFPWDDEKYWRKEGRKISKDPRDYALQVGMDIEHQVAETEDGYFLK
jgi:lysosomal acid lipase/cholesteryl ester hydrolase